jgi:endonuclease/exonuclease/phosphatase (EEP) superfamily protein YafD
VRGTAHRPVRPVRGLLWIPAAALMGGLIGLVAVGWAGAFLPEGPFWWAAMAAVLLPYAAALLALVTLLAAALRRWRWVVASGVVLLLTLGRVVPVEWVQARPNPEPGDLVVLSFNVPRHGETAEGLARDVYALVRAEGPHLAALQGPMAWRRTEGPSVARVADYVRPLLDSLDYRLVVPDLPAERTPQPILALGVDEGVVILEQAATTPLGEATDSGVSNYTRTRFSWKAREAVLYNVHLRGFGPDKPWEEEAFPALKPRAWLPFLRRYRQAYRLRADEVRALRGLLAEETLPLLVVGDFNATRDNWAYRQLARGLTDAFRAGGRGWGGTYRSDLPLVRIDHALADPGFEVVRAHIPDVRFSDHRPLVIRLRWRHEIGTATVGPSEEIVPDAGASGTARP